jgi:hypothetical protein
MPGEILDARQAAKQAWNDTLYQDGAALDFPADPRHMNTFS